MTWPELAISVRLFVATVWLAVAVRTLAARPATGTPAAPTARLGAALEAVAALLLQSGWQIPWLAAAFVARQLYPLGRAIARRWVPSGNDGSAPAGICRDLVLAAGGILLASAPGATGQPASAWRGELLPALLPVVLLLAGALALAYLIDHTAFARRRLRAGWDFDARS